MAKISSLVSSSINSISRQPSQAEKIWKRLNGIFAVYKPPGVTSSRIRRILLMHLCRDLNKCEKRQPEPYVHIEGPTNQKMLVKVEPSFADNELVVGPRYQQDDFKLFYVNPLALNTSGIMLMGINKGTNLAHRMKLSQLTKFYKIKGVLGQATDNFFINGKIIEKSTYKHIKRHHIDMVCAAMQSSHQRKMFEACGVNIQSQAAYELAARGPIRPTETQIPVLYSIKCINFSPPEFTLEIVAINENEEFMKTLVDSLGQQLRTSATCSQIQLFQYGIFGIDLALLKRDWNLENVIKSVRHFRSITLANQYLLKQDDPILRQYDSNNSTAKN